MCSFLNPVQKEVQGHRPSPYTRKYLHTNKGMGMISYFVLLEII